MGQWEDGFLKNYHLIYRCVGRWKYGWMAGCVSGWVD